MPQTETWRPAPVVRARVARATAWTVFALAALAELGTAVMQHVGRAGLAGTVVDVAGGGPAFGIVMALCTLVGAVIVSRVPTNLVGWLFLAVSLDSFHGVLAAYASLGAAGELPGTVPAAWLGTLLGTPGPTPAMLVFLVFPTGELLSRRWRWLVAVILAWVAVMVLGTALAPGALDAHPWLDDLTGVPGSGHALGRAVQIGGVFPAFALPLCLSALVIRFRRSTGVEREQLKWLVLSGVLTTIGVAAVFVTTGVLGFSESSVVGEVVFWAVFLPGIASLPVAAAVAVLRYRLYEIDRLISRTIVYAVVTAVLAGAYAGAVIALQRLLPVGGGSDLAVALSTLVVAAAFGPLRRRVQSLVDRRFNRRHYDANGVVDRFRHHLQHEVHLDALVAGLHHAVGSTVQPRASGLWLARDPRRSRSAVASADARSSGTRRPWR